MSNNEQVGTENQAPIFSLQRIYVKDISFENPNSPEIYERSGTPPKVKMDMAMSHRKVIDDHWELSLKISAETRDAETDKLLFEVEVEQAGLFYIKNIPDEHMPGVLAVDCPTIILPYTRQVISNLTVEGGFMPFLIDPVNFRAIFEQKMRDMQESQNETVQ